MLRSIPGSQMHEDLVCGGPLRRRIRLNARIYQGPDSLRALLRHAGRAQVTPQGPLLAYQFLRTKMVGKGLELLHLRLQGVYNHGGVLARIMRYCSHDI